MADPVKLTFSTEGVPERHRLDHWREAVAKAIIDIDWCPLVDRPFQQRAEIVRLPGLGVVVGTHTSTGFIARRTPELISKGTDTLILRIQLTGKSHQSELGRETTVAPGEAILASSSDVGTVMLKPDSRFVALGLPRPVLAPMINQIQDQVCVLRSRDSEPLKLLRHYLSVVLNGEPIICPELQKLVVAHIYDLVALTLLPTKEATTTAQSRGLPAARLHSIKSDMVANLGDNELTESEIARRHRVTPRYVRMLFETEGTTFSDFLRRTRLTRAHQMLTDRRYRDRTIGSIAYQVGFGDLSHFNRLFRRRYAVRPSEVRAREIPSF